MTFNDTLYMNKVSTRHIKLTLLTAAMLLVTSTAMAQRTETPTSVSVGGSVFGGGNNAMVGGSCTVIINQDNATIHDDVYGGGALAQVNTSDGTTPTTDKSTSVTLMRGIVGRNLYGGGLGERPSTENPTGTAADVFGPVQVTINGGTVTGGVFGCNNNYGAPQNTVVVDVENNLTGVVMNLNNVYGGGNLADYTYAGDYPEVNINKGTVGGSVFGGGLGASAIVTGNPKVIVGDLRTGHESDVAQVDGDVYGGGDAANVVGTTEVLVQKCSTIINGDVYGGGNAADIVKNSSGVGGTASVTVTGGTITGTGHGMVFGGGHGNKDATPDPITANVEVSTSVEIKGGIINKVFGGSNSAGTINDGHSGGISVLVNNTTNACTLHINELYGGGNYAASQVGSIDIRCTGTGDNDDRIDYVYGGANQANITGDIELNIVEGRIGNVFGGNNTSGTISGKITVNINKKVDPAPCIWYVGNVYGGGNLAPYSAPSGTINHPKVNILNGPVSNNVYGGGLGGSATVTGNPVVTIDGGSVGNDVFGGGSEAAVNGATHVIVNNGTVGNDVYGGGALANTGATTVDIMGGTITNNIYGGGLGDSSHSPQESGAVIVNIGSGTPGPNNPGDDFIGDATIGGNVYGSNNTAGSPQDTVIVNVYRTAHTPYDSATYVNPAPSPLEFAIDNVFGGGNQANFVSTKGASVNIYGCYNTIGRVFGGGDAAATPSVETNIQGGRMDKVFGGGNGEAGPPGANVNGNVSLNIHGGTVGEFYGGSNQHGTISGTITTVVDNAGPCGSLNINEFFCGGNFVDITNDLTTTIECSEHMNVASLYGGCNQANITGNVVLNVYGGIYDTIFCGSKGRLPDTEANIYGNVTLNLYGGTIRNVFGGSNVLGNITGIITVNVLDVEDTQCPLYITNIYGGSNVTSYTPTYDPAPGSKRITPIVNVVHAIHGISGNVYGGSKGKAGVTTIVNANPRVNIGYESGMSGLPSTSTYNPALYSRKTTIAGSVFGGGDAAKVEGDTEIHLNNHAKVIGNVYGGGNKAEVNGDTKVIVNGKNGIQ